MHMKKRVRIIIGMVFIIVLLAAGVRLLLTRHGDTPADKLVIYGNVDIRQVELAFNANERISSMLAREGDSVRKGQLLGTLETERLTLAVNRAGAEARAQKEIVAKLRSGSRPEEIRKARADVEAAEAEARNAESNFTRLHLLAEKDLISKQEEEDANAAAAFSKARLKAAEEALKLSLAGSRKEDIESARATLKANEAALSVAKRELSYAYLHAPSDGVIQVRIMEPGDIASPQKPVYTLAITDPLWVRAYLPETEMGKIWLGMSAEVATDSYPGKRYRAWIGFISPTAQFTPKSVETREVRTNLVYQVRVFVCNPQNELRLGMPAEVIIPLNQPRINYDPDRDHCKETDGRKSS
jgi:HlyD family secretion protein